MAKALNCITLGGRLVEDPKVFKETVISMRVAVDYAGNDQTNPENKSGFFNVKMFIRSDDLNHKFVLNQITSGKMKKGSSVALVGELKQETYNNNEGVKTSSVVIVADNLTYNGGSANTSDGAATAKASASIPDEF